MARPRRHLATDCSGSLKTLYVRNGDDLVAVGSRCDVCGFERSLGPAPTPDESRELWALGIRESTDRLSTALRDRQMFERTMEVMNGNASVASSGSIFFRAVQRWYAACQAMAIRRQTDSEPRTASIIATLRDIVAAYSSGQASYMSIAPPGSTAEQIAADAQADIDRIENAARDIQRLARREIEHALPIEEQPRSEVTFRQLHECLELLDEIAVRWTRWITRSAPPSFNPVIQTDWASIFNQAWRPTGAETVWDPPYRLGEDGVPYDAIEPSRDLEDLTPRLSLDVSTIIQNAGALWLPITVENYGKGRARNIRIFLPGVDILHLGAVPLKPKDAVKTRPRFPQKLLSEYFDAFVQVVSECEDILGNLYRQYAKVSLREIDQEIHYVVEALGIPYRVRTRIVAEQRPPAWG